MRFIPSCDALAPENQPLCRCECTGHYVLGRCAADAASREPVPEGGD